MSTENPRHFRQPLPISSIPENDLLSVGSEEFEDRENFICSNLTDHLFSSPRKRLSFNSQTVKQPPRVHPKTVSRLRSSSPAPVPTFRKCRVIVPSISIPVVNATNSVVQNMASSVSPCLSPIRYSSFETNRACSTIEEDIQQIPINHLSSQIEDLSIKVQNETCRFYFEFLFKFKSICRAQTSLSSRILSDVSSRSSLSKSPIRGPVSGLVLGTPDYLSK